MNDHRDDTDDHRDYIEANRAHWDELAEHHPDTDHYDVESFLAGETTLRKLEREEVDAAGKRLLHLQCHFGLDTLSWIRDEGAAHATGVDFSPTAIETARELRDRVGIEPERARFVESDVYDVPDVLEETFELVVTTYGTIYWLPELDPWAEVVASQLAPGGTFYIADGHPLSNPFHYESTADDLRLAHPYFNEAPVVEEGDGSYAGWDFGLDQQRSYGFSHPIGDVVTALVDAGLQIDFLHEFPWSFFDRFEAMEPDEDDRYWLPGVEYDLPLTFSLQARRPATDDDS